MAWLWTSICAHNPVAVKNIAAKVTICFLIIFRFAGEGSAAFRASAVDRYKDKVTDIFPCPAFRKDFNSSNVPYSILPIRV